MSESIAKRTRWGIVGVGDIARRTAKDLRLAANIDVAGVAARDRVSAEAFAAEFGISRAYASAEEMFAATNIDVVYICTPHSSHFELTSAALQAGKNVLCEKAFTLSATEARQLARQAADQHRFLMEAMWMRFNPSVRKLVAMLADGVIGHVRSVHANFSWPFPPDPDDRFWNLALGGGALLDLGVYPLSLAHLLIGAPSTISANGRLSESGVDVRSGIYLENDSGQFAQVSTSMVELLPASALIGGSHGYVTIDPPFYSSGTFRVHRLPDLLPVEVSTPIDGAGYVHMFREVGNAVAAGMTGHPLNPLSHTIEVLEVIDVVRAALKPATSTPGP